jgi:uncharacterized protein (TIGR03000 family)
MTHRFSIGLLGAFAAGVLLLAGSRSAAQFETRIGTFYSPSPGWLGLTDSSGYYTVRVPMEMSGYGYRHYAYHASGNLPTYLTSINYPTIYGAYGYRFAPGRFNYGAGQSEFSTAPVIYSVVGTTSTLTAARVLPETAQTPLAPTATIEVRLPQDAELRFDGTRSTQTGAVRTFVTPPLDPATTYAYDIRANWLENGREVNRTRHVEFRVGDRMVVDFMAPPVPGTSILRAQPLR